MNRGVILFLLLFVMWVSSVSAQTPFYQGKTITIIAAAKAGDVYDLYPRLVAEFMSKHIPGNPNIIIQNVAGAAGLIGTNQVYNLAKPDGLTLGAIYPALYFEQLAKRPEVKFDWTKFHQACGRYSRGQCVRSLRPPRCPVHPKIYSRQS